MTARRFPPPRRVVDTPGGWKVIDANGVAVAYIYGEDRARGVSETRPDAVVAGGWWHTRVRLAVARSASGGAIPDERQPLRIAVHLRQGTQKESRRCGR